MKTLIIYDSTFGNTKIIAEALAKEFGEEAKAILVKDFIDSDILGVELLIVGSPIIRWRPTENIERFLVNLQKDHLKGIKATAFDTRIKLFIHGDAAKKISRILDAIGAEIITEPEVFYVQGNEGPLYSGEVEKAVSWANLITKKI